MAQVNLFNESIFEHNDGLNVLFDQYKLYVELTDKASERRNNVNTFFLSINSILVTGITIIVSQINSNPGNSWWILIATLSGMIFCVTWRRLITSYGHVNAARYKIIHLIETKLPANLFNYEWKILTEDKDYNPFSKTEGLIPLIFLFMYIVVSIIVLIEIFI